MKLPSSAARSRLTIRRWCALALAASSYIGVAVGQTVPTGPRVPADWETTIYELKPGMSTDAVLATLGQSYRIDKYDNDDQSGLWEVSSAGQYRGTLLFEKGRLFHATRSVSNGGPVEVLNELFQTIFNNSGQSELDELPDGLMTRTRRAQIAIRSEEDVSTGPNGSFVTRELHFAINGRQFVLLLGPPGKRLASPGDDGEQRASLEEIVIPR